MTLMTVHFPCKSPCLHDLEMSEANCQSRMLHGIAMEGTPCHVCVFVSVSAIVRDSKLSSLVCNRCLSLSAACFCQPNVTACALQCVLI